MLYRTDDPAADWDAHCEEQERQLAKLPRCSECDHPITTDMCFQINGELVCEDCMDGHRVFTDDFME